MAFLDATMLLDLQADNALNEKRFAELGVIDAVKASTSAIDFIDPSTIQAMHEMSSLRDAQIPVMKDQTVTVTSSPSFVIPANLEETAQYAFTAVNVFSGFRHYPAAYGNNVVRSEWAMKEKMKNILYAMANTTETNLLTSIDARKTQVCANAAQISNTAGDYSFNTGTDLLEIKLAAQKETMFYKLETLMASNELPGNYRVVTNRAGLSIQKSEALKYGAANQFNINALGFAPLDRLHESGNVSAGSDIFNGYYLRDGSVGMIENYPYDFRAGTEFAGKRWSVSDMELPFLKMRGNIWVNNEATDATALVSAGTDSNLQMTHFQEMAIWVRYYFVYRYNSDLTTRANDILKIKGLTT